MGTPRLSPAQTEASHRSPAQTPALPAQTGRPHRWHPCRVPPRHLGDRPLQQPGQSAAEQLGQGHREPSSALSAPRRYSHVQTGSLHAHLPSVTAVLNTACYMIRQRVRALPQAPNVY